VVLRYVSSHASSNDKGAALEIKLKDINYDLFVDLTYQAYTRSDIIAKRAIIRNQTKAPIVLESAQSGAWFLPAGEGYRLSYLAGRWAGETQLIREPIHPGMKILTGQQPDFSLCQKENIASLDEGLDFVQSLLRINFPRIHRHHYG
jgi:alpha-galactosidase